MSSTIKHKSVRIGTRDYLKHILIQKLGYPIVTPDNILKDLKTRTNILPSVLWSPSALGKREDVTAPVYN